MSDGTAEAAGEPIRPSVRAARQRRSASALRRPSTRTPTAARRRGTDPGQGCGHHRVRVVAREGPREVGHRRLGRGAQVPQAPRGKGDHVGVRAPQGRHQPWNILRPGPDPRQRPGGGSTHRLARVLERDEERGHRGPPRRAEPAEGRGTLHAHARRPRARQRRRERGNLGRAVPERLTEQVRHGVPPLEQVARVHGVGDERGPGRAQVVVVHERRGPDPTQRGQQVQATQPLGLAEGGNPLLHHRRRRPGLDLEAEREHDDGEGGPVRLDVPAQGAHLVEEAAHRLPDPRGVGLREEALHAVDLAALGVHQDAHDRRVLVQPRQPAWRAREVVEELRYVVEAHREDRLVRVVGPRDALPGGVLLARGPAPQGHVHHLDPAPLRPKARLEPLRVGLFRPDLRPQRHAVAEDRDPPQALGLLARPRPVPQAVAVELLPRRPPHSVRLHHVEAARHLVVPVPDVVGHLAPRRPRLLQEARRALENREEDGRGRERQGHVDDEAAPQAATVRRRVAAIRSQCVPRQKR